jgi:hypothetical protein
VSLSLDSIAIEEKLAQADIDVANCWQTVENAAGSSRQGTEASNIPTSPHALVLHSAVTLMRPDRSCILSKHMVISLLHFALFTPYSRWHYLELLRLGFLWWAETQSLTSKTRFFEEVSSINFDHSTFKINRLESCSSMGVFLD